MASRYRPHAMHPAGADAGVDLCARGYDLIGGNKENRTIDVSQWNGTGQVFRCDDCEALRGRQAALISCNYGDGVIGYHRMLHLVLTDRSPRMSQGGRVGPPSRPGLELQRHSCTHVVPHSRQTSTLILLKGTRSY